MLVISDSIRGLDIPLLPPILLTDRELDPGIRLRLKLPLLSAKLVLSATVVSDKKSGDDMFVGGRRVVLVQ